MTKYNWQKGEKENEFMAFIIVESMVGNENEEIFGKIIRSKSWNPESVDVELYVNGEKVDIERTFKVIESQIDKMVTEKAGEIISEKLDDSWHNINDLLMSIERYTKRKAKEVLGENIFRED